MDAVFLLGMFLLLALAAPAWGQDSRDRVSDGLTDRLRTWW